MRLVALVTFLLCIGIPISSWGGVEEDIRVVVEKHYQSTVEENAEAYAATMLANDQQRQNLQRNIEAVWAQIGTEALSFESFEASSDTAGQEAVARYTIKAQIVDKRSLDSFIKRETYVALLTNVGGWKIKAINEAIYFRELMRTLWEVDNALANAEMTEGGKEEIFARVEEDDDLERRFARALMPGAIAPPEPSTQASSVISIQPPVSSAGASPVVKAGTVNSQFKPPAEMSPPLPPPTAVQATMGQPVSAKTGSVASLPVVKSGTSSSQLSLPAKLPPPLSPPPGMPPSVKPSPVISTSSAQSPGVPAAAQLPPPLPPPTASKSSKPMSVTSATGAVTSGKLPQKDITPGLLLSYDFTGTSTDKVAEDLSGNGYSGKLKGPVWAGRNGLYFDGKDDYIKVDGGERLHSDTALTVIGEFITTSYTKKTWQNLIWKGNLPDGKGGASDCTRNCENREFALWLSDGAYLHSTSTAKDGVGRGQTYFNTPNGSVDGRTIFAQVIDSAAKSMKVFINGKEAAAQAYSSSGLRRTDGPLLIGGGGPINKGWNFRGYLRWLRIYDRALSEEEIAAITSRRRPETAEPWRDPYLLDDVVVKGGWASIMPIQNDPYFAKLDLSAIEPGIVIQDGWFSTPTNRQETEIVYRHDGSPLRFAGHATVFDCLDYCGSAGSVEQIIRGDDRELWNSGKIMQKGPGKDFDVDLTGVHEIRLVTTDGGNGDGEDWAAWLNLKLTWPDLKAPQASPPVPAMEPTIPPPRPIQITDASTSIGRVDSVYTLDRKPEGAPPVSIKHFPGETEKVVVWFLYQGFEVGDVLTGVWTDIGRQLQLRAVPVVMINAQGATGFSLRRPVAGWARGNYLVEIKKGDKVLNSAQFNIED